MSDADPTPLDFDKLAAWMDAQGLPGAGVPLETKFLSGGSQNEIYLLTRGDFQCVIRIPPAKAPADRDEGILREWRIISALDGTDVPHTPAVAVCTDPSVLGRSFYLMGYVDGWSPMSMKDRAWPEPFNSELDLRKGLGYQLAEGIALLAKVDWKSKDSLWTTATDGSRKIAIGRPDGFHERQVDRWTSFFEKIKIRELEGMDVATEWLRNHRPLDFVPGLMHGDYQFANVMFANEVPAKLAALVDWEMGTVGDPKLDLAWMVVNWPEDTMAPEAREASYVDLYGMPSRDQLVDHYARISGRQVDDFDYYLVLARWKLAIVLERGYARAGDDPKLRAFGPIVEKAMKDAAEVASTTDYSFTGR